MKNKDCLILDRDHIWHPFAKPQNAEPNLYVTKASGAYLYTDDGKAYLDMTASWWSNIHGYSHPTIAEAIYQQAKTLTHVRFADITHPPAIQLTKALLKILPKPIEQIFFSDSGSGAVEVALKMAIQYWRNTNAPHREKIIALQGNFHGETFGAMAVGKSSNFFDHFSNYLFPVEFLPYPETWIGNVNVELAEQKAIDYATNLLNQQHEKIAALILEPIVQGAAGMRCCRPAFIKQITELFQQYGIVVIYDEIMTGFGRLGEMFASNIVGAVPDIICLGKALSNGSLPISITATNCKINSAFKINEPGSILAHGHTYSANPVCCAAATASLAIFNSENTLAKMRQIEQIHLQNLDKFLAVNAICNIRISGSILALTVPSAHATQMNDIKKKLMLKQVLIRPLQNNIYLMPNACTTEQEIENVYNLLINAIQDVVECRKDKR